MAAIRSEDVAYIEARQPNPTANVWLVVGGIIVLALCIAGAASAPGRPAHPATLTRLTLA